MGYYRANVGKGTRKMKARPLFQLSVGWLLKWLVVDGFRRDVSRARRELRAVRTPKIVLRNFYEAERYSSTNRTHAMHRDKLSMTMVKTHHVDRMVQASIKSATRPTPYCTLI